MWIPDIGSDGVFVFQPDTGVGMSTSYNCQVSYETLDGYCQSLNQNISSGSFNDYYPFNLAQSADHQFLCELRIYGNYNPSRYVIRLVDVTSPSRGPWYVAYKNGDLIYCVSDAYNQFSLGPIYTLLNTIDIHIGNIYTAVDTVETTLGNIFGAVDGIEGYLSTIDSSLKYVSGSTTYTVANLCNSIKSNTSTISSRLYYNSTTAGRSVYETWKAVDDVENLLGTINTSISTVGGKLDTLHTDNSATDSILNDIYSRLGTMNDNITTSNAINPVLVSNTLVDDNDNAYTRYPLPYESATEIVAYLNEHFYAKKVAIYDSTNAIANRYFRFAYLASGSNLICVKYSAFNDATHPVYTAYLTDMNHNIFYARDPVYTEYLTTTVNNTQVSIVALVANVDANITSVSLDINAMATGIATMNNTLTPIAQAIANMDIKMNAIATAVANMQNSFTLGGIHINTSTSDPIYTSVLPDVLYSTGYKTDSSDVAYPLVHLALDAASTLIGNINSNSIGDPIHHIVRDGSSYSDRQILSSYVDDDNYIRVVTQTGNNSPTVSYLCDPRQNLYVVDSQPAVVDHWSQFVQIMSGISNQLTSIDGHISALTQPLNNINTSINNLLDYVDYDDLHAISWFDSYITNNADFLDTAFVPAWFNSLYNEFYLPFFDYSLENADRITLYNYFQNPTQYSSNMIPPVE